MGLEISTHTPETENLVSADKWQEMTVNELYEQKMILQNRIFASSEMKNRSVMTQLQRGMVQLEAIIQQKSNGDTIVI